MPLQEDTRKGAYLCRLAKRGVLRRTDVHTKQRSLHPAGYRTVGCKVLRDVPLIWRRS